jgi:hypothetical protein
MNYKNTGLKWHLSQNKLFAKLHFISTTITKALKSAVLGILVFQVLKESIPKGI